MKRFSCLAVMALVLLMLPIWGLAQETADGFQYRLNKDGSITITGYTGSSTMVNIPSRIDDCEVTAIGNGAFLQNENIQTVTLPEGVISIGDGAFKKCTKLTSVDLPSSIITIGESAFESCYELQRIVIPSDVKEISDKTFTYCRGLQEVILPEGLLSIGDDSFSFCRELQEVILPKGLVSIGDFSLSSIGIKSIDLPQGLKSLGSMAFGHNQYLENLIIPNSVSNIDIGAFQDCEKLISVILPAGLSKISPFLINYCPSLEKVAIPLSVKNISESILFEDCYKVTLWGFKGSAAEKYALKHDIPFVTCELSKEVVLQYGEENVAGKKLTIDLNAENKTLQLTAQTSPENPWPGVVWKSSAPTIATVDVSGVVTGLKKGKATITATAVDGSGKKASCEVNIASLAKVITITGENTLQAGKKITLKAETLPDTTDNKKVDWASSDKNIATVSTSGVITAKRVTETKTVIITASAKDGSGIFAEFVITVSP